MRSLVKTHEELFKKHETYDIIPEPADFKTK